MPTSCRSHRALRVLLVPVLAAALVACAPLPARNPLAHWTGSRNHDARRPVLIVLHATEMDSMESALRVLRSRNAGGPVSAHYLIGRDGRIDQLVADSQRAWHAGVGRWNGIAGINGISLGIELDHARGADWPAVQIARLILLLGDLTARWHIEPAQVIAHADLAPTRRDDPGPRFPWGQLAAAGFGHWPHATLTEPPPGFDPWLALRVIGYALDDRGATVRAFHAHFRGCDGDTLDAQDLRILHDLEQQALAPSDSSVVPGAAPATGSSRP